MESAHRMADSLCRLELDLARHQSGIARPAADFVRGNPFSHRDRCSSGSVLRTCALATNADFGLRGPGFYRCIDLRRELRPPFLGRTPRFVRLGSRVAGDHPNLWYAIRASDAPRRAVAAAETCGRAVGAWWRGDDL